MERNARKERKTLRVRQFQGDFAIRTRSDSVSSIDPDVSATLEHTAASPGDDEPSTDTSTSSQPAADALTSSAPQVSSSRGQAGSAIVPFFLEQSRTHTQAAPRTQAYPAPRGFPDESARNAAIFDHNVAIRAVQEANTPAVAQFLSRVFISAKIATFRQQEITGRLFPTWTHQRGLIVRADDAVTLERLIVRVFEWNDSLRQWLNVTYFRTAMRAIMLNIDDVWTPANEQVYSQWADRTIRRARPGDTIHILVGLDETIAFNMPKLALPQNEQSATGNVMEIE